MGFNYFCPMFKSGLLPLLVVVIFLLSSCEGNTYKERIIRNSSTSAIHVRANTSFDENFESDLAPGDEVLLGVVDDLGGSSRPDNPASVIYDMVITNSDQDTMTKDYQLMENWIIEIREEQKIPSSYHHKYIFEVNDTDF